MKSAFQSGIAAMLGLIVVWQLIVSLTDVPRFILYLLICEAFVDNFDLIAEHTLSRCMRSAD